MKSILQHLNANGILYAGVPNIDNFGKGQFQNAHIYYFSPRTFHYYMTMCDLEMIKCGSAENYHMYGIFKLTTKGSDFSRSVRVPKKPIQGIKNKNTPLEPNAIKMSNDAVFIGDSRNSVSNLSRYQYLPNHIFSNISV